MPPPPKSNYDHYVECKYCGRKFAADVAERHIPKCQNIINKPGGIKPSQIQQKYVGSSGVVKQNNFGTTGQVVKTPPISSIKGVSGQKTGSSYIKPQSPMKPLKSPLGNSNSQYGRMFKK